MHFTPDLVSIWIENEAPEVGDIVGVDVRIHNIKSAGEINVSLWAWEPQPNSEPFIIQLESQEISMDARQSILLSLDLKLGEKDLQVYFILNNDVD